MRLSAGDLGLLVLNGLIVRRIAVIGRTAVEVIGSGDVVRACSPRQSIAWSYFLNGALRTMVTRAGDPLAVKESHTADYQESGDTPRRSGRHDVVRAGSIGAKW